MRNAGWMTASSDQPSRSRDASKSKLSSGRRQPVEVVKWDPLVSSGKTYAQGTEGLQSASLLRLNQYSTVSFREIRTKWIGHGTSVAGLSYRCSTKPDRTYPADEIHSHICFALSITCGDGSTRLSGHYEKCWQCCCDKVAYPTCPPAPHPLQHHE